MPAPARHFAWLEKTFKRDNGLYAVPLQATGMNNSPRQEAYLPRRFQRPDGRQRPVHVRPVRHPQRQGNRLPLQEGLLRAEDPHQLPDVEREGTHVLRPGPQGRPGQGEDPGLLLAPAGRDPQRGEGRSADPALERPAHLRPGPPLPLPGRLGEGVRPARRRLPRLRLPPPHLHGHQRPGEIRQVRDGPRVRGQAPVLRAGEPAHREGLHREPLRGLFPDPGGPRRLERAPGLPPHHVPALRRPCPPSP